jgi:predicted permease
MPFMMLPMGKPDIGFLERHQYGGYDLVGRLAPGFSIGQATAELRSIAAGLEAEFQTTNKGESAMVVPLAGIHPASQSSARGGAALLAATSICLLVLACANVGGMLLARGITRRKEIAIRFSLGASQWDVVRQLLMESCILGAGAAGGGILFGWWITGAIRVWTEESYVNVDPRLTPGAAAIAIACACLCILLFAVIPAMLASRPQAVESLRAGGGTETRLRLRPVLVSGQIGIAVVLLTGAGLLIESLQNFLSQAGAGADRIAAFRLRPLRLGYSFEKASQFQRRLLTQILSVPGVEEAALARVGPGRRWCCPVPVKAGDESVEIAEVENNHVTPGFLRMLRIPLLAGRELVESDRAGAPLVALVNETLARRLWGPGSPIGRTFTSGKETFSVVGLAKDVHPSRPGEPPVPYIYFAYWQKDLGDSRLFVRVAGSAQSFIPRLRSEIVSVDPDVHIGQERSLRDMVAMTYRMEALLGTVLSFCAAIAVLLAGAGLYAAIAFTVGQRRREIAIRMAVGAAPSQIIVFVLGGGFALAAAGVAAGLGISAVTSKILTSYLYGVFPVNGRTYILSSLTLFAVAIVACTVPAFAAARVSPSEALRSE